MSLIVKKIHINSQKDEFGGDKILFKILFLEEVLLLRKFNPCLTNVPISEHSFNFHFL